MEPILNQSDVKVKYSVAGKESMAKRCQTDQPPVSIYCTVPSPAQHRGGGGGRQI